MLSEKKRQNNKPSKQGKYENRKNHRPRDTRLARQPHCRSRRNAGMRRHGPCRRAFGRIDWRTRGSGAARRRQAPLWRQGNAESRRECESDHSPCPHRPIGTGTADHRPQDAPTGRHAHQIASGCQCHPRRVACRGQGSRLCARHSFI